MAFVFDATVAGASANSYATVEYADDYQDANLNRQTWVDASTPNKQAALAMATRTLDAELSLPGDKGTVDQRLRWPRTGVYTRDGEYVDSATVPTAWKDAVCELAFWFLTSDRLADNDTAAIRRMKLDTLEIEFAGSSVSGNKTQVIPDIVLAMLADYGIVSEGYNVAVKLER